MFTALYNPAYDTKTTNLRVKNMHVEKIFLWHQKNSLKAFGLV